MTKKLTVAIAGARGFVGSALVDDLKDDFQIIGLSRRAHDDQDGVEWRSCDLFSRKDAEDALRGADIVVYLVHSMLPSARLTQGGFEDMDLICADNFARAAAENRVRQIVYLGGLIPEGVKLSKHLESRLEVEKALGSYGVPVTSLRAGLVVGAGGSSSEVVLRLVDRLPVMLCPSWTRTKTQPIALHDVVGLLRFAIGNKECFDKAFDVGGPDVMSYKKMMEETADLLGIDRSFTDVPFFSPRFSTLWVSLVTGAPRELIGPLVSSLKFPMVCTDDRIFQMSGLVPTPFQVAMADAVEGRKNVGSPAAFDRSGSRNAGESTVRSVQRLPLPAGKNATWVAQEYARWLPGFMRPFLRVEVEPEQEVRFFARGLTRPLLRMEFVKGTRQNRQLFWIRGGMLAKPSRRGRLEFREVLDGGSILAAIHDYRPQLPWFVYRYSQALVHLYVMWGFRRHLAGIQPSSDHP